MKYMFIAAHPDDIELACGGLISKLAKNEKAEIYFLVCTQGELGGDPHIRADEQIESLNKISENISFRNLLWEDGNIQVSGSSVRTIEGIIESFEPDFIFTHAKEDTHQDHAAVSRIVKSICFRKGKNLIFFDSSSSIGFEPNFFVPINFEEKREIINAFKSQVERSNILIRAEAKDRFYGCCAKKEYAEAYHIEYLIDKNIFGFYN